MSTPPILDFDPSPSAIINPPQSEMDTSLPECAVLTFFWEAVNEHVEENGLESSISFKSEMPDIPIYIDVKRQHALVSMPVGAPLCAGLLEELIARGVKRCVVCGGAGVLESIPEGTILLPTEALRDEGLSYHYLPPDAKACPDPKVFEDICNTLKAHSVPYQKVITWTTDAFYRETRKIVALRQSQGAACVEMEAAALFAVASFRKIALAQILYGGDDLSGETWDSRHWNKRFSLRRNILNLAIEACLA